MKPSFKDYAAEEVDEILNGRTLLAPEDLLPRWKLSSKELRKLYSGQHPSGVYLPAIRFGLKTVRFRLCDVVRVEHELYGREI